MLALVAVILGTLGSTGSTAAAAATSSATGTVTAPRQGEPQASGSTKGQNRDVELNVEAGVGGSIQPGVPLPLRIGIKSSRARTVSIMVSTNGEPQVTSVDLSADTRFDLDMTVRWSPWIDISVMNVRQDILANRSLVISPDSTRTAVGVGRALASRGVPDTVATVGGIQTASLVTLDDAFLARPAAMETLSGIVLSATDLDDMTEPFRDRLRTWVWAGGDLVLDVPSRPTLPVVDLTATGDATPVGAGWVRFSGGAAEAGGWSGILSPSVVRSGQPLDGFAPWVSSGRLVDVDFISTWFITLAIFGTAFLGGPILWMALRTRRRRQYMWVITPALSVLVAALLLITGQSVFSKATTSIRAAVTGTAWGASGSVASGLNKSSEFELSDGVEVMSSNPVGTLVSAGGTNSLRIDLPRNSFGRVALGGVTLADAPDVQLTAVDTGDGAAKVTIVNGSKATLSNISITGNGRLRDFGSVPAGESRSHPFEMTKDVSVFAEVLRDPEGMIPDDPWSLGVLPPISNPGSGGSIPVSRGLVLVTGLIKTRISGGGLKGTGPVAFRTYVPVQPPASGASLASIRIESIGGLSHAQREQVAQSAIDVNGGIDEGFVQNNVPTTVTVPEGESDSSGGIEVPGAIGQAFDPKSPEYLRISAPGGRPAGTCGVSTMVPDVSIWDGAGWSPLDKVGLPRVDPGILNIQGDPLEVQDWAFPAIAPGERLYIQVTGRIFVTPLPLLFSCGGAS